MVTTLLNQRAAREAGYEMAQYIAARATPLMLIGQTAVNVSIGKVPAGAVITNIYSRVAIALAGGTPLLTYGSNGPATYDNLVATVAEAAGSEDLMPLTGQAGPLAADTEFFMRISGGPFTNGDVIAAIQFIKPLA